jgi:hypothetical protein
MSNENERIPMHKRIAMGEKLDGTSLAPKGGAEKKKTPTPSVAKKNK